MIQMSRKLFGTSTVTPLAVANDSPCRKPLRLLPSGSPYYLAWPNGYKGGFTAHPVIHLLKFRGADDIYVLTNKPGDEFSKLVGIHGFLTSGRRRAGFLSLEVST